MKRSNTGFTLIETIITLAVISIVLSIAIPSFKSLLLSNRAASARYQLTYTLASARVAAIVSRQPVSVCPVTDDLRCRKDGVWENGWMVFRDAGSIGQPQNADEIITIVDGLDKSLQLRSTAGRKLARFQPDGRSGGSTLTLSVCVAADGAPMGQVVLNNAGRSRVVKQPGEDRTCATAS